MEALGLMSHCEEQNSLLIAPGKRSRLAPVFPEVTEPNSSSAIPAQAQLRAGDRSME